MGDTIVAVATAPGIASISIVRLSGPEALEIAKKIAPHFPAEKRRLHLCTILDRDGVAIDKGLVVYFEGPESFTGEDIVEFQSHGGMVVAEEILESLISKGARPAEPGEFSKRAFLNGKIDMSEAEAIAGLIESRSADAARILTRQIAGELGDFVRHSRDEMLGAIAHAEVMIDYAEEDIPDDIVDNLKKRLTELSARLDEIVASSRRRKGMIEGFRVAIVGKPNVGKSSLLNAFLRYERAIVSEYAGTTRDTIEEQVRIGSHIVRMIDTAGIRKTGDEIEKIGVERSYESIKNADIVIAMFDSSQPMDREDEEILTLVRNMDDSVRIVALNKCDLPQILDDDRIESLSPVRISAKNDFAPLMEEMRKRLDELGGDMEIMLTTARQMEAVERCRDEIEYSIPPLERGELELFSFHMNEAVKSISSITKPMQSEEILDRMFGEFCLGK